MANLWKVVEVELPEAVVCPVTNGYAVAYATPIKVEASNSFDDAIAFLIIVRYSGFALRHHALTHSNNLNIWNTPHWDIRLGLTMCVNVRFLYDVC